MRLPNDIRICVKKWKNCWIFGKFHDCSNIFRTDEVADVIETMRNTVAEKEEEKTPALKTNDI